jgi:hypothetical protein
VTEQAHISAYISRLDTLGVEDIASLNHEIAAAPWCATYRMLLAKAYANQGSYQKNKSLRKAATYTGSREQLFELMHTDQVLSKDSAKEEKKDAKISISDPVVEPIIEAKKEEEITVSDQPEVVMTEEIVPGEIEEITAEEAIPETTLESVVEDADIAIKESDLVQPDATTPSDEETEQSAETKGDSPVTPPKKEAIDFDKIVKYDPLKELSALQKSKEKKRVEIPFDQVIYNPEKELNKLIAKKEEPEKKEKDFLSWLNNVEEDSAPKPKKDNFKSPDKVQDLLDQFLATKRTRPIHNGTFYNVNTRAEQSEHDNMNVLSETLVELYVRQNHLEKAIKGYTKLSLQNPEKSAYFAALIKELEQQQKESQ